MSASCDLRNTAKSGGCAAKLDPLTLRRLMEGLAPKGHPDLLVGLAPADDAAVFRISEDVALVQTLDFITPVVDDPHLFGQVAAANALSDVWAMGGRPATAMNICCFPEKGVEAETLGRILQGGLSKIEEAGAILVGGHTVRDDELKYGLSVAGFVHPRRIARKGGLRTGDRLVLTKPVGSGVAIAGAKRGLLSAERLRAIFEALAVLNGTAAETMMEFEIEGATDVTGFGLGGHALEMARAARKGVRIFADRVPAFADIPGLLAQGVSTGAAAGLFALIDAETTWEASVGPAERGLLTDPQTSGGLLIAVRPSDAEPLLGRLRARGVRDAAIIGEVFDTDVPRLHVTKS